MARQPITDNSTPPPAQQLFPQLRPQDPPAPNIPGITPGADLLQGGNQLYRGADRLTHLLQDRGLKLGSAQADDFLASGQMSSAIGSVSGDPEFWDAYLNEWLKARNRQSLRKQYPGLTAEEELAIEQGRVPNPRVKDQLAPNERTALREDNQPGKAAAASSRAIAAHNKAVADARVANENATRGQPHGNIPLIVDLHGNPTGQSAGQPAPLTQTGAMAGGPATLPGTVFDGGHVWIATASQTVTDVPKPVLDEKGKPKLDKDGKPITVNPQGNTVHGQDQYMSSDDAKASLYAMSPQQVQQIQHSFGLPESGTVDPKTFNLWSDAVDIAAGYTMAGKHIAPVTVLGLLAKSARGGGGGGGGGAGGGGAKFKLSDVQALLTSVTQKELGRDPTQAEVDEFFQYFGGRAGGDSANPSQIATDWVRGHAGSEQGSYGAATNYYQGMLAVLGGSAIGGSGG